MNPKPNGKIAEAITRRLEAREHVKDADGVHSLYLAAHSGAESAAGAYYRLTGATISATPHEATSHAGPPATSQSASEAEAAAERIILKANATAERIISAAQREPAPTNHGASVTPQVIPGEATSEATPGGIPVYSGDNIPAPTPPPRGATATMDGHSQRLNRLLAEARETIEQERGKLRELEASASVLYAERDALLADKRSMAERAELLAEQIRTKQAIIERYEQAEGLTATVDQDQRAGELAEYEATLKEERAELTRRHEATAHRMSLLDEREADIEETEQLAAMLGERGAALDKRENKIREREQHLQQMAQELHEHEADLTRRETSAALTAIAAECVPEEQTPEEVEQAEAEADTERARAGYISAETSSLFSYIIEQGGIRPSSEDLREEYREIPPTYRRPDGVPGDEMADLLATDRPELGIETERDLLEFFETRRRQARHARATA